MNSKKKINKRILLKIWFQYLGAIMPRAVAASTIRFSAQPRRYLPKVTDKPLIEAGKELHEITDNYDVVGYDWGNNTNDVALLLHGWSSHALSMRNFVKPLLNKNYRVIAFDAPGHGRSNSQHKTLTYKKLVGDLIDKYKPKTIIAHSAGALYALLELKTRVNIEVKNMVTIGMPLNAIFTVELYLNEFSMHKFARKHFWNKIRSSWQINFQDLDLTTVYANQIGINGIIVHDVNDMTIPYSHAVELHKLWPKSQLITTHGYGHSLVLKNNEVINNIINSLII
ncbi:MAG: alpha/beta hydrolase [Burkholderiales bacterium]|nr:alpha/beta hydrolase [Burkholderiales bacterium]